VTDYDHTQIDEVIHSRLRLAIMAALMAVERMEFTALRETVKATDGNLSTHLRKLEEVNYVQMDKKFVDRKPRTECALTDTGRAAFRAYVARLEALVRS
jgi:DNA-binding HxlR family transcriptional regulator